MIQSLTSFVGMFPRYTAYTLDRTAAQNLVDGRVTSNGLEAYREDLIIQRIDKAYPDFYRHYRSDGSGQWLFFDTKVDVCKGGVLDDLTNRTFITGLDTFRVFDSDTLKKGQQTIDSTNSYIVAVPKPEAPSVSIKTAGSGSEETRTYAISYARVWDSEKIDLGDISSPALNGDLTYIDTKTDASILISNIKTDVEEGHNVNRVYVYRSSVTSSGEASYRYVIDFPIKPTAEVVEGVTYDTANNTVSYLDTKRGEDLGEVPENIGWTAPPDDLKGIVSMRNGVLAGFKDNTVYLSVPYQGHAWPDAFKYPSDYSIVGLGAFGNTLVVCTNAITYLLNTSDPSLAFLTPIQDAHACVSKESIVSIDNACIYATKYGLIRITGNGASLVTRPLISDVEWIKLGPHTIRAAMHRGQYVMFWDSASSTSDTFDLRGYVIDFNEMERGMVGISQSATGIFNDLVDNSLYLIYKHNTDNSHIIASFADSPYRRRAYTWTSKTFLDNTGLFNLSAGKVNFHEGRLDLSPGPVFVYEESHNPLNSNQVNTFCINGDANTHDKNKTIVGDDWCLLYLYVDDVLRHVEKVYNNRPFRLPAGFRGDSYYITLTSTEPITRVQVASSIGELE